MERFEIREVDAQDEADLRAWWEVGRAASAERAFDAWPAWEVSRAAIPQPREDIRLVLVGAHEAGRLVGAGMLVLFLLDNPHLAEVNVYVAPEHRRRGIGRAVLADLEQRARAGRRTSVLSSAYAPLDAESPGSAFAQAMGYPVASHEQTKLLDLTTAPAAWGEVEREVADALGDYRIDVFDRRTPDGYVDDLSGLLSALIGEIPTGDLDLEDAEWTVQRLRDYEQRALASGRVPIFGVAVAPEGHLCGFTDMSVHLADPRHASIGGTMVLPGHRGHRLGLGMKLASHRRLLELFPGCCFIETGNAGVNAAMNKVNDRLGYRVVERCLDVQKRL